MDAFAHDVCPKCELELQRCTCWDDAPYVCPGCYAVGGERCAPDCIDAAIAREREGHMECDL